MIMVLMSAAALWACETEDTGSPDGAVTVDLSLPDKALPDGPVSDAAAPDQALPDGPGSDALAPCPKGQYTPGSCGAHPAGPYGSTIGAVLGPFDPQLKDCDLKKVKLRDLTCGSALVLVSVGAGWCKPCIEESKTLEQTHARFCARGLGMVSVLYQDTKHQIPTSTFCATWKKTFGLTFPVLLDQLEQTKSLMSYATGTPLNLLVVSKTMKIVARWTGKVPADLEKRIDAELKKLGR